MADADLGCALSRPGRLEINPCQRFRTQSITMRSALQPAGGPGQLHKCPEGVTGTWTNEVSLPLPSLNCFFPEVGDTTVTSKSWQALQNTRLTVTLAARRLSCPCGVSYANSLSLAEPKYHTDGASLARTLCTTLSYCVLARPAQFCLPRIIRYCV